MGAQASPRCAHLHILLSLVHLVRGRVNLSFEQIERTELLAELDSELAELHRILGVGTVSNPTHV